MDDYYRGREEPLQRSGNWRKQEGHRKIIGKKRVKSEDGWKPNVGETEETTLSPELKNGGLIKKGQEAQ